MDLLAYLPSFAGFFAVLALLCAALWMGRRSQGMLLWMGAAWGYAALGLAVLAGMGQDWQAARWASVVLLALACGHAAQAMAWRFGRRIQMVYVAIGGALALLGGGWWSYAVVPPAWSWHAVVVGLAVVAGHVLPAAWRMPSRHWAERSLLVVYSLWCASLAASMGWAQMLPSGMPVAMLLCLGAAAVTAAMLACVRADGFSLSLGGAQRPAAVGVVDRATFEKSFNRQSAEQQISYLVLCDLDQFRSQHQQWGESTSSALLAQFAQLLQTSVRAGDHVVRVAHDEFALALRHVDRSNAQALVQRILEAMRLQPWAQSGSAGRVTASFGVCMVRDTDTLEMALHRADVLLCQAKDAGGDRLAIEEGRPARMARAA